MTYLNHLGSLTAACFPFVIHFMCIYISLR